MIFGEVLIENRFWTDTIKILKNSQNVILRSQFLSMFPRLLSNFDQLNTFRTEQRKIFVKIDFCTAVKFDEFLLLCVYVTFLVCHFLFLLCFFPKTQKDQKYFCCFSSPFVCFGFLHLFRFICYCQFAIRKPKKILLCLLVSFVLVSNSKTPKIFAVLLWFVKFILSSMVFGGWSMVFISYYPSYTSEKAIMTIYDNLIVVRGWYELYLFSFLYIYSSM